MRRRTSKENPIEMIPCVDAVDLPKEVEDWCIDNDISTHYASEVHQIHDDGNPLAEYLKVHGYKFRCKKEEFEFDWVGVIGT